MARLIEGIRAALRWIGRHELGTILAVFTIAAGGFVFIRIWSELLEGESLALDSKLLLALRHPENLAQPVGPGWLPDAVRDITALGSASVLLLITLGFVGYLALIRKPHAAVLLAVSVIGASFLSAGLKAIVGRARPDVVPHLVHVSSASFPSGHSMMSTAVYLTIGTLVGTVESNLVLRAYVLGCAAFLSFIVGLSRVYAGVHWPSDVLGGWAAGAAWSALCWMAARALQRRGEVEPATATKPS